MKTRTILLGGALAVGVVGAAAAAVTSCPVPAHKPIHHVASYHAKPRPVTRQVRVLANAQGPTYTEAAPPPPPVVHERVYAAAYPGPVYYDEPYPAYYPGAYAYGPVVYGYGGPYWGARWGYGYRGWHGGWRGGGHFRR